MSEEKNYELMYYSLKRLHESANKAVEELQKHNREIDIENTVLKAKLINADKNVEINKTIVINTLLDQNKMKDDFILEINLLRERINFLELDR
jgi:hypothetical protein